MAILLIPFLNVNGQGIGELAPPKPPEIFPSRAVGVDIIFNEGGFGLGGFYRNRFTNVLTGFVYFSISEAKDPREITYIDYWGNTYTLNKINRAFVLPLFVGLQYRLFEKVLYDNLRPYVNFAFGPAMVASDPYDKEFFNALGYAKAYFTVGGYVGLGANFGLDRNNLVGINLRYYFIHLFNQGIPLLIGRPEKEFGGFYITVNLGTMF